MPEFSFDHLEDQAAGTMERSPEATGTGEEIINREIAELTGAQASEQGPSGSQNSPVVSASKNDKGVDSAGVQFDATIHTGTKLKDGTWRKKKGAGVARSIVARSGNASTASGLSAESVQKPFNPAAAKAAALMATNAYFSTCRVFGKEFKPEPDEFANVRDAMEAYFIAKQIDDFPPGVALAIACGGHIGARLQQPEKYPETAVKVSRIKMWFALRVAKWKIRREFKKMKMDPNRVQIVNGSLVVDGNIVDVQAAMAEAERQLKE